MILYYKLEKKNSWQYIEYNMKKSSDRIYFYLVVSQIIMESKINYYHIPNIS